MEEFKNQIVNISSGKYIQSQLVSILILCVDELDINTISEMARKEGKTPRGIKISNQYKKVKIGKQVFAIKGLKEDNFTF